MQHQSDNEKTKKPWYRPKKIMDYTRRTEYATQGVGAVLNVIDRFATNVGFASLFITILALPFHLYNIIYGLAWSKENDLSRATRVLIGFGGIALSLISIVAAVGLISVAAPILAMVGAAKSLAENIWRTGLSIYDRFFGQGSADAKEIKHLRDVIKTQWPATEAQFQRLTELTNRQRKRNGQIATGLHIIAMNVVGTIAVGLLFSGVTSAAGIGILAGVGVYGALDAVGLNPLKRAGQLINWGWKKFTGKALFSPFTPKTTDELKAELYNELTKKNPVAAKTPSPVTPAMIASNSEKQIITELQKNSPAPAPTITPLEPHVFDPAHPLTNYLNKAGSVTDATGNMKQAKPPKEDEAEDEGEGEHPTKPFKNHG